MKKGIVLQLTCSLIATAVIGQVYLRDPLTGLFYGPIDSKPGPTFTLPEGEYETVMPTTNEQQVVKILHETYIAEINWTNANMSTVTKFLQNQFAGSNSLSFHFDTTGYVTPPWLYGTCGLETPYRDKVPLVNLTVRHVTCFQILHHVSRATFLPITISGTNVSFTQQKIGPNGTRRGIGP
jgi:hypothetical protein